MGRETICVVAVEMDVPAVELPTRVVWLPGSTSEMVNVIVGEVPVGAIVLLMMRFSSFAPNPSKMAELDDVTVALKRTT